jgi:hypothetical protein
MLTTHEHIIKQDFGTSLRVTKGGLLNSVRYDLEVHCFLARNIRSDTKRSCDHLSVEQQVLSRYCILCA